VAVRQQVEGMAWLVGSRVLRAPINIVIISLLAHVIGPTGVGLFALLQAAAVLLHAGLLHWLQAPLVFFGRSELDRTGSVALTLSSRLPLLAGGLTLALGLIVTNPGGWMQGFFGLPGSVWGLLPLALLGIWLMVEAQSLSEISSELRALALAPIINDIAIACLLAALWFFGPKHPDQALVLLVVFAIPIITWGGLVLFVLGRNGSRITRPQSGVMGKIVGYGWPLVPGMLLAWTFEWSGPLMLEHLKGKHDVGVFQLAFRMSQAIIAMAGPLTSVLLPRLISRNLTDPFAGRNFLERAVPSIIVFWLLAVLPLLAILPELVRLLAGELFAASVPALVVLAIAVPGSIVVTLYGTVFAAEGQMFKTAIVYSSIMTAVSLATMALLVPRLGVTGAAAGITAGYLTIQSVYLLDQHHRHKVSLLPVIGPLLLGIGTAVLLGMASHSPLVRAGLCLIGLAGICACARHFRVVNPSVLHELIPQKFQRLEKSFRWLLVR
jgi:O-antigen/teichoic acid export membrane protein